MAKKSASSIVKKRYPQRSADVPVTQAMLYLVRDGLKADIAGSAAALKGDIKSLDSKLTSELHRLGLLIEEQNARNAIVLDGLTSLFTRQDRVESQVEALSATLVDLKIKTT